jgi:hypothetical protein
MIYATDRSHRMQKHMFDITRPDTLFMETTPGQPEHENSESPFHALDAPECTT